jgi:hypothetical protein
MEQQHLLVNTLKPGDLKEGNGHSMVFLSL